MTKFKDKHKIENSAIDALVKEKEISSSTKHPIRELFKEMEIVKESF